MVKHRAHSFFAWHSFIVGCCIAAALLTVSCGTGIEVTERVTEKDVMKVINQVDNRPQLRTLDAFIDSVPAWKAGKRFWVADDQARLLFAHSSDYDIDTVSLAGHVLTYVGYDTGGIYDNRNTVNLRFSDGNDLYVYRTGKTLDAFHPRFSIPMLIDLDMVDYVAQQVTGKDFFIRTGIWYDRLTEQMIDGRHFIKVHIDEVLPGNAVLPLRVYFTAIDSGERAMVWMSENASTMLGRDFDALFVNKDPRLEFPTVSDENWECITRGQVELGMTKDECRLSMGTPARISENPFQGGLREYWYYDGGAYLFFVDGVLTQFRN